MPDSFSAIFAGGPEDGKMQRIDQRFVEQDHLYFDQAADIPFEELRTPDQKLKPWYERIQIVRHVYKWNGLKIKEVRVYEYIGTAP